MRAEGAVFSVMVGIGETYLAPFALALGAAQVWAGLLLTLPLVAGGILQLVSPVVVRRLGSRRAWVLICAWVQAASFVPLVIAALTGRGSVALVYGVAVVYWAAGMATGPAWNTWAGTLVPRRVRTGFFAGRAALMHLGMALGLFAGGIVLEYTGNRQLLLQGFAILFGVAGLSRGISAYLLWRQPEPGGPYRDDRIMSLRAIGTRFRGTGEARLLRYLLVFSLSVAVASPFFTPYMLVHLNLSYGAYMILLAVALAVRVLAAPLAGRFAQRYGVGRLLRVSAAGIIPMAGLWAIDGGFAYLLVLQVFSGVVWAGHELAAFLMFFDTTDERDRTAVLTLYNFGNATALAVGSVIGGIAFQSLGAGATAYAAIFIASSVFRIVTMLLLAKVPGTELPKVRLVMRPLAVRPGWGTISRPIVSTIRRRRRWERSRRRDRDEAATGSPRTPR
jgi:MFS family permease